MSSGATCVSSYAMVAVPLRKLAFTLMTPLQRLSCLSTPAPSKMDIMPSTCTVVSFMLSRFPPGSAFRRPPDMSSRLGLRQVPDEGHQGVGVLSTHLLGGHLALPFDDRLGELGVGLGLDGGRAQVARLEGLAHRRVAGAVGTVAADALLLVDCCRVACGGCGRGQRRREDGKQCGEGGGRRGSGDPRAGLPRFRDHGGLSPWLRRSFVMLGSGGAPRVAIGLKVEAVDLALRRDGRHLVGAVEVGAGNAETALRVVGEDSLAVIAVVEQRWRGRVAKVVAAVVVVEADAADAVGHRL